jgi:phosphoesterase RecJ-like protein
MNKLEKIAQIIKENNSFLITSHIRPDGDSIGSQLALGRILERLGKEVMIVNHDPVPPVYDFLPGSEKIVRKLCSPRDFEIAFVLDSPDFSRLGSTKELVKKAKVIVNIDHHLGNGEFGKYNYIDVQASAVGEEIYELLNLMELEIDKEIALYLYVGILADTGSFQQSNTTARTHEITARLIELGNVKPAEIYHRIYEIQPPSVIKLLGMTLATLGISRDGQIAWMIVTGEMFKRSKTTPAATENFINYVRSVGGNRVAVLFIEMPADEVKVSFRSQDRINVNAIARTFGGGGHLRAAACTIKGDLPEVKKMVLAKVRQELSSH